MHDHKEIDTSTNILVEAGQYWNDCSVEETTTLVSAFILSVTFFGGMLPSQMQMWCSHNKKLEV